jgi:hypothetical protein
MKNFFAFLLLATLFTLPSISEDGTWKNKSIALGIGQPYGLAGAKFETTTFDKNILFQFGAGYNFVNDVVFNFGLAYNKNINSWLDMNAGIMYGANQVLEVSTPTGNVAATSDGLSLGVNADFLVSKHFAIELGTVYILTRSQNYKDLLSLTATTPSDLTLQLGIKYSF